MKTILHVEHDAFGDYELEASDTATAVAIAQSLVNLENQICLSQLDDDDPEIPRYRQELKEELTKISEWLPNGRTVYNSSDACRRLWLQWTGNEMTPEQNQAREAQTTFWTYAVVNWEEIRDEPTSFFDYVPKVLWKTQEEAKAAAETDILDLRKEDAHFNPEAPDEDLVKYGEEINWTGAEGGTLVWPTDGRGDWEVYHVYPMEVTK